MLCAASCLARTRLAATWMLRLSKLAATTLAALVLVLTTSIAASAQEALPPPISVENATIAEALHIAAARKALTDSGVKPTIEGLQKLLERMAPSDTFDDWAKEQIAALSDGSFEVRQQATQQLATTPGIPQALLENAQKNGDPEVRWRARVIAQLRQVSVNALLLGALTLIEHDAAKFSAASLVAAAEAFDSPTLQPRFLQVVARVAQPSEQALYSELLRTKNSSVRLSAAIALASIERDPESKLLIELTTDPDEQVVLGVSQVLVRAGDRRALLPLARLLSSDDLPIRRYAYRYLVAISGQTLGYSPTLPDADRKQAAEKWEAWVAQDSSTAMLVMPPRFSLADRGELGDQLLIATGGSGRVRLIESDGKVSWEFAMQSWHAEKMGSGNIMIASHWNSRVVEVNASGTIVWQLQGPNAIRALPLTSGNVLIADFSGKRALEVSRTNEIVWEFTAPDNVFAVDRLDDGTTIVACPSVILEVSRTGEVSHKWAVKGRLNSVQVEPSGTLLIADYQGDRIVRIDREGKELWSAKIVRPTDVYRSPEGKIFVATATQLVEISESGEVLREIMRSQSGSIRGS